MVQSVEITNFRGFESFRVDALAPINMIVGDNGIGKTALLESIYLALSGHIQQQMNLRIWRGQDTAFAAGNGNAVVDSIFADLFHDPSKDSFSIKLTGVGYENRTLLVSKTRGDVLIPTTSSTTPPTPSGNRHNRRAEKAKKIQTPQFGDAVLMPINFTWTDENGHQHTVGMRITTIGMELQGTGENLPNAYFFPAQAPVSPKEAAKHYSDLKRGRDTKRFDAVFKSAFEQILEIYVETTGASESLVVDVPTAKRPLPLPVYSGGTNRLAAVMLAMAQRHHGLVLVDEVDNGLFYSRHKKISKALLELSRAYETQIIMTTHSDEWIQNFIDAASENSTDILFWRMERMKDGRPTLRRFTLPEYVSGASVGEMR